jgi:hypothetical protein
MATDAWGHSWGGPFTRFVRWGAAEQVTLPTFGPPFLDRVCALTTTLGAVSPLVTTLGMSNPISPDIELQTPFRSPRIDRSMT